VSDEIPMTREYVVDESYPSRAAFAVVKQFFSRRPMLWVALGFAIVAAILALLGIGLMWFFAAFFVLFTVAFPFTMFRMIRRSLHRLYPPGTILRTGFGETRFAAEAPQFTSAMDYSYYDRSERRGEFIALRQRVDKGWLLFPGVLASDEDLARFPQR
jgi:hypothetical protein